MEDIPSDSMQSEPKHSYLFPCNSSLLESGKNIMRSEEVTQNGEHGKVSPQATSQALWSTGTLTGQIQNGFYSVIPDKMLKEHFLTIPTPDELSSLGRAALKAEIVIVDAEKDKKLSMLKQLTAALVKGLNSNPASLVKKIAGLVIDFYKRPDPELSPAKSSIEEINSNSIENRGRLLGQIKNGSCRPRAILFKVLADSVGLETKLIEGIPSDGVLEYMESYKHLSVVVVLNSVELLVDLMRSPGQLIPLSDRAIYMSHIAVAEDESVEYDSCDSPLEPNSPIFGFVDRKSGKCSDKNEFLLSMYQRRFDGQSNLPDPSLRNLLLKSSSERNYSSSHSVPNIANAFWRGSRRRAAAIEQQTAYSSSEDPLSSTSTRSTISNKQHLTREYTEDVGASSPDDQLSRRFIQSTIRNNQRSTRESTDDIGVSRSEGASAFGRRRSKRRSTSLIPEIGDDVVRAVRGMNETLKQNRLLNRQIGEGYEFHTQNAKDVDDLSKDVSSCHLDGPPAYNVLNRRINPNQKAVSLPSSPLHPSCRNSESSQSTDFMNEKDLMATWSQVLHSSPFRNKPLLPFEDWNIDFSELTVGTRVGIGFFGEVFRGTWYGTDVAIKVFLEQDLTVENMVDFCNEVSIMSRLRHPNVILFLGACMKPPHLSMITEYMEMGSLYYLVHMSGQKKKISWRKRLKMLRDICRGLMCMHRMKIVHRDLKSANCLVNKHWVVKICDFGLSRVMTEEPMNDNTSAGTPEWMAPELMRNGSFTEKCDIFSLGVIMWELCTLTRPWEGIPPVQVVYEVSNKGTRLEIPEGPLGRLISDCWKEPEERPSCQEILTRLLECEYALC